MRHLAEEMTELLERITTAIAAKRAVGSKRSSARGARIARPRTGAALIARIAAFVAAFRTAIRESRLLTSCTTATFTTVGITRLTSGASDGNPTIFSFGSGALAGAG